MEEAIEVGAYGLGPPIDIWEVGPSGVAQANEQEITALKDTAHLLREREVEMLERFSSGLSRKGIPFWADL